MAFASDHAGYELKTSLIEYMIGKGYETKDFGTHSEESCDYPDFAHPCARAVERENAILALLCVDQAMESQ